MDHATVTNWELKRTAPALRFLPGVICFLGYSPFPSNQSFAERLRAWRRNRGISQEQLAGMLGIDPGTLARWERGHRRPGAALLERLEAVLPTL